MTKIKDCLSELKKDIYGADQPVYICAGCGNYSDANPNFIPKGTKIVLFVCGYCKYHRSYKKTTERYISSYMYLDKFGNLIKMEDII